MKNPSRKAILTYAILVLAILLLDLCFAYPSLHFSYEPQGETVDLFSAYYSYSLNTEFDEESLYFTQSGDDPQLYLTDMEQTLGGITISLAEPLDSDMRVEVFYQTTEMPGLSARKSVVTTLYTGERSCNVKLPLHTYHSLRLDLDGSYQLDSITGCSGTMKKTPVLNGAFFLVLLKWLPLSIPAVLLIFLAHRDRYQKTGTLVKSLFVLPENDTRNHGYDFLRVLAALMVISMHACRNALAEMAMEGVGYHFVNILFLTALSCNTLYMMLSGALLLQDRQETVLHFYARRFGKVVIPLLCYYVLFLDFNQVFDDSLWDGIRVSLQMILSGAPGFAPQFLAGVHPDCPVPVYSLPAEDVKNPQHPDAPDAGAAHSHSESAHLLPATSGHQFRCDLLPGLLAGSLYPWLLYDHKRGSQKQPPVSAYRRVLPTPLHPDGLHHPGKYCLYFQLCTHHLVYLLCLVCPGSQL